MFPFRRMSTSQARYRTAVERAQLGMSQALTALDQEWGTECPDLAYEQRAYACELAEVLRLRLLETEMARRGMTDEALRRLTNQLPAR